MVRMAHPETESVEAFPPSGSVSDARLIEEVRQGDHSAFESLVRRYENRLIGVLLRFVRDRELARDLAQETFLRVYERIDQFDPSRTIRALAVSDWGQPGPRLPAETPAADLALALQRQPPRKRARSGGGRSARSARSRTGSAAGAGIDSREIPDGPDPARPRELFDFGNRRHFAPQRSDDPLALGRSPDAFSGILAAPPVGRRGAD